MSSLAWSALAAPFLFQYLFGGKKHIPYNPGPIPAQKKKKKKRVRPEAHGNKPVATPYYSHPRAKSHRHEYDYLFKSDNSYQTLQ